MALANYLLIAVIGCYLSLTTADYCNLASCKSKPHTMCLYRSTQPSNQCGKVDSTVLTPNEQRAVLDSHNNYRRKVASGQETRGPYGGQPAGYIPDLAWDNELALIAQRWAMQCQFSHDKCRNTEKSAVGQNIAIQSYSNGYNGKWTDMVTMWYDEVKDYNRNEVSKFVSHSTPMIGHYTQLVWGSTTHVGCAGIKYHSNDGWYNMYLVCNYGPAGNWIGQPVYRTR